MRRALHLAIEQAKRLLIPLLLAASPNQDGLRDVLTGCAHALEPTLEHGRRVSPLQWNIGAVVLWAIEQEDEEAVILVFPHTHEKAHILRSSGGKGWADLQFKTGGWIEQEREQE